MKYLKYFKQTSAYESYKTSSDYVTPNVSYIEELKNLPKDDPRKAVLFNPNTTIVITPTVEVRIGETYPELGEYFRNLYQELLNEYVPNYNTLEYEEGSICVYTLSDENHPGTILYNGEYYDKSSTDWMKYISGISSKDYDGNLGLIESVIFYIYIENGKDYCSSAFISHGYRYTELSFTGEAQSGGE